MTRGKYFIHADDVGASQGVTDSIVRLCDQGLINSVSIMVTGADFERAVMEFKKRPHIRRVLHLDLIEGRPLLPVNEVPLLVNKAGVMNGSFICLWGRYWLSRGYSRKSFEQQVRMEISAQINKFKKAFADNEQPLRIDSHHHVHMIPFISEILMGFHQQFRFSYIRTFNERFCIFFERGSWQTVFGENILKFIFLNLLSVGFRRVLKANMIATSDYSVGILFAKKMCRQAVDTALKALENIPTGAVVEILFHPGKAYDWEAGIWEKGSRRAVFYMSDDRSDEVEGLRAALQLVYRSSIQ